MLTTSPTYRLAGTEAQGTSLSVKELAMNNSSENSSIACLEIAEPHLKSWFKVGKPTICARSSFGVEVGGRGRKNLVRASSVRGVLAEKGPRRACRFAPIVDRPR